MSASVSFSTRIAALAALPIVLSACGAPGAPDTDPTDAVQWTAPNPYDGSYIAFGTPAQVECTNLLVGAFGPNTLDIRVQDPSLYAVWAFERIEGVEMIDPPHGMVDGVQFELAWTHEYTDAEADATTRHASTWLGFFDGDKMKGVLTQQLTFLEDGRTCTVTWDMYAAPTE